MIDIRRRGFLFGAAAALVVPPVKTFHLMPRLPLVVPPRPVLDIEKIVAMMRALDANDMPGGKRWMVVSEELHRTLVQEVSDGNY